MHEILKHMQNNMNYILIIFVIYVVIIGIENNFTYIGKMSRII